MSSYSELVKNFENTRAYMRDFYVYGFKSRSDYNRKSLRSYDDERRRVESWIGEYMGFCRTSEGQNIFISIDSRISVNNPFYKALKAKSFTDRDITLHFILFDILNSSDALFSLSEILAKIDEYLSDFVHPMVFDESTVRKKLKEYISEGIIVAEKSGKHVMYRRADYIELPENNDILHFYSEIAPCGVIGSFLLDKYEKHDEVFCFKHHYITSALDSDIFASLFEAMQCRCEIIVHNHTRRSSGSEIRLVPLRIFISSQNGRCHLLAYDIRNQYIKSFRIDYLSNVRISSPCDRYDEYRAKLNNSMRFMWGVNCKDNEDNLEHVEFTVRAESGEEYIFRRLQREKRIGVVEQIDNTHWKFSADVYDTTELIPWIRTFICRITQLDFSNKIIEKRFKSDIEKMYRMYGIAEGDN